MKKILLFLGAVWSLLYPPKVAEKVGLVMCYLYTGYYKFRFKSFGKGTAIRPSEHYRRSGQGTGCPADRRTIYRRIYLRPALLGIV